MLRAPHSPGSGPRARPRGSPAAHPRPRCAPGQATRLASDSKQCLAQCAQGRSRSRTGSGIRGALAPPQFGLALFGWRLSEEKGQLEAPRLRRPPPRPGVVPQARGCHRGRAESLLVSQKGSKEAAAIRCFPSLTTSISFSIFYSFGFQIGPGGGGVQICGSWRQVANRSILLREEQQKDWKSGFWLVFVTDSLLSWTSSLSSQFPHS